MQMILKDMLPGRSGNRERNGRGKEAKQWGNFRPSLQSDPAGNWNIKDTTGLCPNSSCWVLRSCTDPSMACGTDAEAEAQDH